MQKLLLLSVMITTFALPVSIARRRVPHEYEATLAHFAVFAAVYVFLLLFLYPRLS